MPSILLLKSDGRSLQEFHPDASLWSQSHPKGLPRQTPRPAGSGRIAPDCLVFSSLVPDSPQRLFEAVCFSQRLVYLQCGIEPLPPRLIQVFPVAEQDPSLPHDAPTTVLVILLLLCGPAYLVRIVVHQLHNMGMVGIHKADIHCSTYCIYSIVVSLFYWMAPIRLSEEPKKYVTLQTEKQVRSGQIGLIPLWSLATVLRLTPSNKTLNF